MIERAFPAHNTRTENPCVGGSIPPSATKTKQLHHLRKAACLISRVVSNIQCFAAASILLLAGCNLAPEERAQWNQQSTFAPVVDDPSISVVRVGVVRDSLAYGGERGVYRIRDNKTGAEFIGVSGVGIAETASHLAGKVPVGDER